MRRGPNFLSKTYDTFDKGMMTVLGRGNAPSNSLLVAENCRAHSGTIVPRDGQKYLDDDISVPHTINGLYEYGRQYTGVGNTPLIYRTYLFSAGKYLYAWDGPGDATIWELADDMSSDNIYVATYGDWAYICNGIDAVRRFDGITLEGLGASVDLYPPTLAPVASIYSNDGILSGYRKYKYRYVKKVGADIIAKSNFSPEGTSPQLTISKVRVSFVESTNSEVTHIEIYATRHYDDPANPRTTFYRVATIVNMTGFWIDNIENIEIKEEDIADDSAEYIGSLQGLNKLMYFKDRFYGIVEKEDPSMLVYSNLGDPTTWAINNWIDIRRDDGDIITALGVIGNSLYIFKNYSVWVMTGDPDASPYLQPVVGGDATSNQTEIRIGCTSPRSLASTPDGLIFYSKYHGVYLVTSDGLREELSSNVSKDIIGMDDCAGGVYRDTKGDLYYVLAPRSGSAWVCHLPSRSWVTDTNVNPLCFLVDHNGYLLGGTGGFVNRFYDPSASDDNNDIIQCKARSAWDQYSPQGHKDAILRNITLMSSTNFGFATLNIYDRDENVDSTIINEYDSVIPVGGLADRLFSIEFIWNKGDIESFTVEYQKRRSHK